MVFALTFIPYHLYLTIYTLPFENVQPTYWLQASFSEQLHFSLHCAPYTPTPHGYKQSSPKNPMHSMWTKHFLRRKNSCDSKLYIQKTSSRKSSKNKANQLVLTLCFHLPVHIPVIFLYPEQHSRVILQLNYEVLLYICQLNFYFVHLCCFVC